MSQFKRQR